MFARLKYAMAALVTTAVILPAIPASAGTTSGFGDVADNAYFTTPITWLNDTGITSGVESGCFGPFDVVTRGQIAVFLFGLDRTLGNAPIAGPNPFKDVRADYQIGPVGWLAASNITSGVTVDTFEPEAPITRGDFAALLWAYAGQPEGAPRHSFIDVTASYQQAPISWMAQRGITKGTTTETFSPNGLVSRAEAATFLFNYASPTSVQPVGTSSDCPRPLRNALISAGLTVDEATCATPHLKEFSVEYLTQVVSGEIPPTTSLLDALVTIQSNGCLTTERVVELVQAYF